MSKLSGSGESNSPTAKESLREAEAMLREIVEKNGFWPSGPEDQLYKLEVLAKMARRRIKDAIHEIES